MGYHRCSFCAIRLGAAVVRAAPITASCASAAGRVGVTIRARSIVAATRWTHASDRGGSIEGASFTIMAWVDGLGVAAGWAAVVTMTKMIVVAAGTIIVVAAAIRIIAPVAITGADDADVGDRVVSVARAITGTIRAVGLVIAAGGQQ